jgi:hypothetical protein
MNLKEMGKENANLQKIAAVDCNRYRRSQFDCKCTKERGSAQMCGNACCGFK